MPRQAGVAKKRGRGRKRKSLIVILRLGKSGNDLCSRLLQKTTPAGPLEQVQHHVGIILAPPPPLQPLHQPMNVATTSTLLNHQDPHHGQTIGGQSSSTMDVGIGSSRTLPSPFRMDAAGNELNTAHTEQGVGIHNKPSALDAHLPDPPITTKTPPSPSPSPKTDAPLLVGQKDHAPQRPHPSQDLIALYGLSPLAATVARIDPVTGEKINRLRKSYEGQVRSLGLAGRNKAVKHDEGGLGMGLEELVQWPEEEWQTQKVGTNALAKGFSAGVLEKLSKAMKFEPGALPKAKNDEWEYILGHEKLRPAQTTTDSKPKQVTQANGKPTKINGLVNGATAAPAASEAARPRRVGKKRRYDEGSFEGYGEGFVDDDVMSVDAAESSNEGSRRSIFKKKRRRDYSDTSPPSIPTRGTSYGPGMIHQPTGVGAYGR